MSLNARSTSGMVQSVQVVTTVSTLWSSSGMSSAEPFRSASGGAARLAVRPAMDSSFDEGSSPITSLAAGP